MGTTLKAFVLVAILATSVYASNVPQDSTQAPPATTNGQVPPISGNIPHDQTARLPGEILQFLLQTMLAII